MTQIIIIVFSREAAMERKSKTGGRKKDGVTVMECDSNKHGCRGRDNDGGSVGR